MQEKLYWIWLSRLSNTVDLKTIYKLLNNLKTPDRIWKLSKKDLKMQCISEIEIDEITKIEYRQNLENYAFYMEKEKIEIINYFDKKYPEQLRNMYNPPIVIYAKGNSGILSQKAIGIVGCRLCSKYGKEMSKKFSYELSKENIVIISGLARGIDTYAHIGCIKARRKYNCSTWIWT